MSNLKKKIVAIQRVTLINVKHTLEQASDGRLEFPIDLAKGSKGMIVSFTLSRILFELKLKKKQPVGLLL